MMSFPDLDMPERCTGAPLLAISSLQPSSVASLA